MEIRMELNQRHGRGFQLRLIHGPTNKVYDNEALDLYQAGAYAATLLEMMNKELGTSYELNQVVRVPEDALIANASTDFTAARMLQDIRSKTFALSTPAQQDMKMMEIDGQEEAMLSARGVVLLCYLTWKDDGNKKAREAVRRYCEYIAAHGCKGGASKLLSELDGLDKDAGLEWIRRTYAQNGVDNNSLIEYVMGRWRNPQGRFCTIITQIRRRENRGNGNYWSNYFRGGRCIRRVAGIDRKTELMPEN